MAYEAANKRFGPGEKPKSHITGTTVYRKFVFKRILIRQLDFIETEARNRIYIF